MALRDPLSLQEQLANLDHLSGGRLSLGISRNEWLGEFGAQALSPTRRGGRLEETITLLKRLWSEEEVSFKGCHFNVYKASIGVQPAQPEGIPILVGGTWVTSLRQAAMQADGWVHPPSGTPLEVNLYCRALKAYASEAGRDPDSLELGKVIYLAIDEDKGRARERIAPRLQAFYSPFCRFDIDNWCAFGSPDQCADVIRGFLYAGIGTVMLCPALPDVHELERLHREVLPLLG